MCRDGDSEWVPYHKAYETWQKQPATRDQPENAPKSKLPDSESPSSRKIVFNRRFFLIGAGILTLLALGIGLILGIHKSGKRDSARKELSTTIKAMIAVSLATERGVQRSEFRQLVLSAKTEYKSIEVESIDELYPEVIQEIDKAFACWEAADFFWEFDTSPITLKTIGVGIIAEMRDHLDKSIGEDAFGKLNKAMEGSGGIGTLLWDNGEKERDQVIKMLLGVASKHLDEVRQKLDSH